MAQPDVIDETQLGGLAEAAGLEGVSAIMDAFWTTTQDLTADLIKAVKEADPGGAAASSHALKGSAANIGATALADRAKAIETAAKDGDFAGALTALEALPADIAATRSAIDALLARYR